MTNVVLSQSQEKARGNFNLFLADKDAKYFILSGFAGSGKSFLVKYLIQSAREEYDLMRHIVPDMPKWKFLFSATTNKAAAVLEDLGGDECEEGMTVFRALGFNLRTNYKTGEQEIHMTARDNLQHNMVLIVDEASMINPQLLNLIREKMNKTSYNVKVLFVGDAYQLPPVKHQVCPVFAVTGLDEDHPYVNFLSDIQRQAADSPIVSYAHTFRDNLDDASKPWADVPSCEDIVQYETQEEFDQAYQDAVIANPDQVKGLAWTNKRTGQMTNMVREALNMPKGMLAEGEMVVANRVVMDRRRKKVVCATDSTWVIERIEADYLGEFEGWQVTLRPAGRTYVVDGKPRVFVPASWADVNKRLKELKKQKAWREYYEINESMADLRANYAQTVHKSQGSTYAEVFIDVNDIGGCNDWKTVARLMYVAITRARFKVHLFGSLPERYNRMETRTAWEIFNEQANET
jgi:hypothetical protein